MAYENVKLRYPNMTIDNTYFYTFDLSYNSLLCRVDDGDMAFNYPLDIDFDYVGSTGLTGSYTTHYDGFYFWTLQRIDGNNGVVVRTWDIYDQVICTLDREFVYENTAYNTYVSSAMGVENYHTTLVSGVIAGGKTIEIDEYYDNVVVSGTKLYIGPNLSGNRESVTVSGVNVDQVVLVSGTLYSYNEGDEVHIAPSFFIFNEYSGTSTSGSLMRFDAHTGDFLSKDTSSEYKGVSAATFYRLEEIFEDYPDAHTLIYVKGAQAKLRNMSDLLSIYEAGSRNEDFTGADYSYPDEDDWERTGTPYILDNRLFLNTVIDGTDEISSKYRLMGDFEVQVSGALGGFNVINSNESYLRHYMGFSSESTSTAIGVSYAHGYAWTPANMDTALWLDAAASGTITLDGSNNVEQWDDKSGNDRHMVQTNASLRPTVTTSGINGKDVVTFNDSFNQRISVSHNFGDSVSIFHVQYTTDSQYIMFGRGDTGVYGVCCDPGSTSNISHYFGSPTYFIDGEETTISNRSVFHSLLDSRVSLVECVGANLTYWSSFMLSGYVSSSWMFDGDVAELIIVSGVPSEEDRQRIEGYLAHKWGLEDELPVGHPYKEKIPYTHGFASFGDTFYGIYTEDGGAISDDGTSISGSEYVFRANRSGSSLKYYYKTSVSGVFDPTWQPVGSGVINDAACDISLGVISAGLTVSGSYFDDLIYSSGEIYYSSSNVPFYGIMQMDNVKSDGSTLIDVYDLATYGDSLYRLQEEASYYGNDYSWSSYNYQVSPIRSFINSISVTAYPVILPANGLNVSAVTAIVQDQYGEGSVNVPVFFVDDDDVGFVTITPAYTDLFVKTGEANSNYKAGTEIRTVTIEGTATQYD